MSENDDSHSLSNSSDSEDEEYLMSSSHENREAIIRRKLLESFYGTTSPTAAASADLSDPDVFDPTVSPPSDPHRLRLSSQELPGKRNHLKSSDLDSIHFAPSLYTSKLIHTADTSQILKETNDLSQSIRLLDSTMQTLVYENYSKFISATGAIRSIGQSVDHSNEGLERLLDRMQRIEKNTQMLENNLSSKRKQVVEKLKLKRLLNRLTRLVELPRTLERMKSEGKYRSFMRDYLDAMKILTQHTDNFESLKHIEGECDEIVSKTVEELGFKMWIWCGGNVNIGMGRRKTQTGKSGVLDKFRVSGRILGASDAGNLDIVPPASIEEIYECACALFMYAKSKREHLQSVRNENATYDVDRPEYKARTVLKNLTDIECKTMAMESVTWYLEGILEDHTLDIQETVGDSSYMDQSLYPAKFLDDLFQAVSLYGQAFNSKTIHDDEQVEIKAISDIDSEMLKEYVTVWFNSFLNHVRNVLLDRTAEASGDYKTTGQGKDTDDDDDDDEIFASISNELIKLVKSVRELASKLAHPEVGLDMEVASSLVEQAVGTTESMVKRRVTQKFKLLRVKMIRDCILPFITSLHGENIPVGSLKLSSILQAANSSLSNGMQYVDDTIRSILCSGFDGKVYNTPLDLGMIKMAVRKNVQTFAVWLATILESIAVCDSTSKDITLEVHNLLKVEDEDKSYDLKKVMEALAFVEQDDDSCFDHDLLQELTGNIQNNIPETSMDMLNLGLLEICRVAQKHLASNINQSITNATEEKNQDYSKERTRDLRDNVDSDSLISYRFLLASSTLLAVYTRDKGHEAASTLCHSMPDTSSIQSTFLPHGPSDAAIKVFEVVRNVCLDSAQLFDGSSTASDVPNFGDDYRQNMSMVGSLGRTSNFGYSTGTAKGLSLDVARMFTQKVPAYSQALDKMSFNRDFVVNAVLRVAFRAWNEQIRLTSLTSYAYRQIQVDVEFFKYLLPHFVTEDSADFETVCTVLNDVLLSASERCIDAAIVGTTEYYDESVNRVVSPLLIALRWLKEEEAAGARGALGKIVIHKKMKGDQKQNASSSVGSSLYT